MMEIPSSYCEGLYRFLANEFEATDLRKDDLLLCVLKTLKILYLFAQNKQLSPNAYMVLSSLDSAITVSSFAHSTADLTDSLALGLWYYRESPEGKIGGKENIFEVLNQAKQGYSLKYDRNESVLEFNVHHQDGSKVTHPVCKAGSHTWNQLTVTQGFTKCRNRSSRAKTSKGDRQSKRL